MALRPADSSSQWVELDVLRGLACVLMVANHATVSWLSERLQATEPFKAIAFVGSLAPVVFFTATGIGRGIQGARRAPPPFWSVARKIAVLFLADAALWLSPERSFGVDFLGFIGFSALVLELVRRTRRHNLIALGIVAVLLVSRYAVAAKLHIGPGGFARSLAHVLLGDLDVAGFSYLPSPWLCFPLLGLLLGGALGSQATWIRAHRMSLALGCGAACLAGAAFCLVLAHRGMGFFRWGIVSFAYLMYAFTGLAASLGLALLAGTRPSSAITRALSVPGPASFLLVPMHYAFVGLLSAFWTFSALDFSVALVVLIPLVLVVSVKLAQALRKATEAHPLPQGWVLGAIVLALSGLCLTTAPLLRLLLSTVAQVLACSLFLSSSRPAASLATAGPVA